MAALIRGVRVALFLVAVDLFSSMQALDVRNGIGVLLIMVGLLGLLGVWLQRQARERLRAFVWGSVFIALAADVFARGEQLNRVADYCVSAVSWLIS